MVDPAEGLPAERDVAIAGARIARVVSSLSRGDAREVLDSAGALVTPGLIDGHVHVYEGVAPSASPPTRIASPRA